MVCAFQKGVRAKDAYVSRESRRWRVRRTRVLVHGRAVRDCKGSVLFERLGDPDTRVQRGPQREDSVNLTMVEEENRIEACPASSQFSRMV